MLFDTTQVCREAYPPVVCVLLWLLCEVSIVALDLTMVLGTAVGLNLLLGWPMLPCILLTSLDALLLLLLVPRCVRTRARGTAWSRRDNHSMLSAPWPTALPATATALPPTNRHGVRTSEALTVGLVVAVVGCFMVDLMLSKPPLQVTRAGGHACAFAVSGVMRPAALMPLGCSNLHTTHAHCLPACLPPRLCWVAWCRACSVTACTWRCACWAPM
jgi:hypothetical protein